MGKDKIFEDTKVGNPLCVLADGTKKSYAFLNSYDNVLVRDLNSSTFIQGKILEFKYPRKTWIYKVETKNGTSWKYPSDFKTLTQKRDVRKESFQKFSIQDITVMEIVAEIGFKESIFDAAKKLKKLKYPRDKVICALRHCYTGINSVEAAGYFDLAGI